MHVAHSNINPVAKPKRKVMPKRSSWAMRHAYREYKNVLKERSDDIKEIQKYFPGWLPSFEY